MPIYEYRCADCRRKVSIFVRSIAAAHDPTCPNCGGAKLERLVSRVVVRRGGVRAEEAPPERDSGADYGMGDEFGPYGDEGLDDDPFGMGQFGLDEDADPREIARWTRQMSAQMGEPLEPDLDRALTDIERGADPDEVLDQLEEMGPPVLPDRESEG